MYFFTRKKTLLELREGIKYTTNYFDKRRKRTYLLKIVLQIKFIDHTLNLSMHIYIIYFFFASIV